MTKAEMIKRLLRERDFRNILAVFSLFFGRVFATISRKPEIYFGKIAENEEIVFSVTDNPVVSIVIPVHNQWQMTHSCLYSLRLHDQGIPLEVIFADDASTDRSAEINQYVSGIRVMRNVNNVGFLNNCNKAAKLARGKYLLFLNNDTNVQAGWLKPLVDLLEQDVKVGMVGPKFLYPDGRLQEAGCIVWDDASAWAYGRWDDPRRSKYNYAREVDYVAGACFLIHKNLWDAIDGFDERYAPAYCEDADIAFEVRRRGFKVIYQPASEVVHFEGTSYGMDIKHGLKSYQLINQGKFSAKWQVVLKNEHSPPGKLNSALRCEYQEFTNRRFEASAT